jgi:hypothetical protein
MRTPTSSGNFDELYPMSKKGCNATSILVIEWDNREITTELLGVVAADDDLLDKNCWKCFKNIAK